MQDQYIAGLQRQDQKVFSALYDAYGGALFGVVLRIVQSNELAEQVLQDTFMKIWRNGAATWANGKSRSAAMAKCITSR